MKLTMTDEEMDAAVAADIARLRDEANRFAAQLQEHVERARKRDPEWDYREDEQAQWLDAAYRDTMGIATRLASEYARTVLVIRWPKPLVIPGTL